MPLLILPDELLETVCQYIERTHDLNSLSQTCRRIHNIADSVLYLKDAQHYGYEAVRWAASTENEDTIRRAFALGVDVADACQGDGILYSVVILRHFGILR